MFTKWTTLSPVVTHNLSQKLPPLCDVIYDLSRGFVVKTVEDQADVFGMSVENGGCERR